MAYKCLFCGSVINDKNMCPYCGSDSEHIIVYFKDETDATSSVSTKKITPNMRNLIAFKIKSTKILLDNLVIYYELNKNSNFEEASKIKEAILIELNVYTNYLNISGQEKDKVRTSLIGSLKENLQLNKTILETNSSFFNKQIILSEDNKILNNLLKLFKEENHD